MTTTMKRKSALLLAGALTAGIGLLSGCSDSQANVASANISTAADNFQIPRQIIFLDVITNSVIEEIDGLCSIDNSDHGQVSVTCKHEDGKFSKDFLGKSDNVTWWAHQVGTAAVSTAHYKVIWRPSTVIPNISVQ